MLSGGIAPYVKDPHTITRICFQQLKNGYGTDVYKARAHPTASTKRWLCRAGAREDDQCLMVHSLKMNPQHTVADDGLLAALMPVISNAIVSNWSHPPIQ